jgi:hypothetical protein
MPYKCKKDQVKWKRCYYAEHRAYILAQRSAYYFANRRRELRRQHKYTRENWDEIKLKHACWRAINRDVELAKRRRYYRENREKHRAHIAVAEALNKGILVKRPCVVCGKKAEGHHNDYAKPLAVVWLCRRHHLQFHSKWLQLPLNVVK